MLRWWNDPVETPPGVWRGIPDGDTIGVVPYFLWSLALIGVAAIAVAVVGALMPPGTRLEVLLSLLAGAGVGVAGFAAGLLAGLDAVSSTVLTRLFFVATCLGGAAVAIVLVVVWRRRWAYAAGVSGDGEDAIAVASAATGGHPPAARPASSARASGAVPPGHPPARRRGARALAG
jgi:hypothetical protein